MTEDEAKFGTQLALEAVVAAHTSFTRPDMTSDSHLSNRTVSFRYVLGVLVLTLAALVVLAITPLGSVLTTAGAGVVMRSLMLGWLVLALVVDVKNWDDYSRSRRHFAFAIWFFLGTVTLSGFLIG